MKKLLAALALSALVAGPSLADAPKKPAPGKKPPTEAQKEAKDKNKGAVDDKTAKADEAKAKELYKQAAALDKKAHDEWIAAGKLWEAREQALHRMHQEQANARALRHAALKLNAAANKLFKAESDRAQALNDRLAADQLLKSAHSHLANAAAEKTAITEGQKAEADLKGNPAFANAIKDIEADIKNNQTAEAKNEAAAKADADVARKLLADADKKEAEANALEKSVAPPIHVAVKPPPAPKAIVAKAVPPPHK